MAGAGKVIPYGFFIRTQAIFQTKAALPRTHSKTRRIRYCCLSNISIYQMKTGLCSKYFFCFFQEILASNTNLLKLCEKKVFKKLRCTVFFTSPVFVSFLFLVNQESSNNSFSGHACVCAGRGPGTLHHALEYGETRFVWLWQGMSCLHGGSAAAGGIHLQGRLISSLTKSPRVSQSVSRFPGSL